MSALADLYVRGENSLESRLRVTRAHVEALCSAAVADMLPAGKYMTASLRDVADTLDSLKDAIEQALALEADAATPHVVDPYELGFKDGWRSCLSHQRDPKGRGPVSRETLAELTRLSDVDGWREHAASQNPA